MATDVATPKQMVMADLKGKVDPDWCPGCGDFGVLAAVQKALVELQIPNHEVATISGIGCSSNFPGLHQYLRHAHAAWPLAAVATGLKLANHGMTVLVTGGDGDGFGIGGNHFVHTMRRNVDLTLHRHGQPDLRPHHRPDLAHQPHRHEDQEHALWQRRRRRSIPSRWRCLPGPPLSRAASAREQKHLTELIKQGIQHKGFSFIDVFSPCVTYNHDNTFQWFRPRVKKLEDNPEYDSTNWMAAMEKSLLWGDEIPIGKFFERTDVPTLHESEPVLATEPLVKQSSRIPPDVARAFVEELM